MKTENKSGFPAGTLVLTANQDGQYGRLTIADALHKLLIEGGDYDE